MLHQTAFSLPRTLALLTSVRPDIDFPRWHHVTGSRVTVSTGSAKCPTVSVRVFITGIPTGIMRRFQFYFREIMELWHVRVDREINLLLK